jgi:hypothetical protein
MLRRFTLGLMIFFCFIVPTFAQADDIVRLAFVQNNALYVLDPGSETPVLVDDTPSNNYYAAWSPDGEMLAYITLNKENMTLHVWDGAKSIELLTDLHLPFDMPINWTPEGKILYLSLSSPDTYDYYQAYTIDPVAGSEPELLSDQVETLMTGGGPGDSTALPMQWALNRENGDHGKPFLALTDYGLVYPSSPLGTGSLQPLDGGFTNHFSDPSYGESVVDVAVSPDGQFAAGVSDYGDAGLVMIQIDTSNVNQLSTHEAPQQVAWDSEGNLYYSSEIRIGNLLKHLTPEQRWTYMTYGLTTETAHGSMIAENRMDIYRIAPDQTETPVLEGFDAYGIGRMQVVGSTLYFSAVNNGAEWVEGNSEEISELLFDEERNANYFHINVYKIDLTTPDAEPVLVIEDAAEFVAAGQ